MKLTRMNMSRDVRPVNLCRCGKYLAQHADGTGKLNCPDGSGRFQTMSHAQYRKIQLRKYNRQLVRELLET